MTVIIRIIRFIYSCQPLVQCRSSHVNLVARRIADRIIRRVLIFRSNAEYPSCASAAGEATIQVQAMPTNRRFAKIGKKRDTIAHKNL